MVQRAAQVSRFLASDPVRRAPVGQAPHTVLHRQNKARLLHFAPVEATRTPVFVSMPLINTWTVFDLLPDRSVLRSLVDGGTPVYLLDWGAPRPEDAEVTLAELVHGVLARAWDRARRHARAQGAEALDALGYCVGGSFLTLFAASRPVGLRKLALLCTPIDFHASGRLAVWATPEHFPLDAAVDGFGNFPSALMRSSFAWLRPMGQLQRVKSLWDRIEHPGFRDTWAAVERWNGDNIDFAGEAYREYVRRCYFENRLMTGGWTLGGVPVDLGRGEVDVLVLAASRDHICPPEAAFGLAAVWGGRVDTRVLPGGHVGVCLGRGLPAALDAWSC